MKTRLLLVPLLLLFAMMTGAGPAKAGCDEPQTQTEMNICARADFETADDELNNVYGAAISGLSPAHRAALKKAQLAWITYRDLACRSYGLMAEGGTMASMLVSNCMAEVTRQRTKILSDQAISN